MWPTSRMSEVEQKLQMLKGEMLELEKRPNYKSDIDLLIHDSKMSSSKVAGLESRLANDITSTRENALEQSRYLS